MPEDSRRRTARTPVTRDRVLRQIVLPIAVVAALVVAVVALFSTAPVAPKPSSSPVVSPPKKTAYKLVWHDEFTEKSLDPAKWSAMDHSTFGDGNNELACLMDRSQNLSISKGILRLTARRESTPIQCGSHDSRFPGGRDYTSAFIQTLGHASFTYGKIAIRAKLPTTPGSSQGLWPAFWLRPVNGSLGELDVFEAIGSGPGQPSQSTTASQAIHYDYSGTYPQQNSKYHLKSGSFASSYHVFAVTWKPGSILWTIDGHPVFSRTDQTTPWLDQAFTGPFYIRLNLAVGGNGVGEPPPATKLPASYDIDWVRVYQDPKITPPSS